jgi:hypothetical protein
VWEPRGFRTVVSKAFRSGFYWPTALADAEPLVRRCTNCQFFGKQPHVPAHNLIAIPPSWPFAYWGLDMIGPLTTAPGGFTHVLVAINMFTKWIEYKPITTLLADRVVTFICDILHRFGFSNISTRISSGISVNAVSLKSNMFQWLTCGPMARLSMPTA